MLVVKTGIEVLRQKSKSEGGVLVSFAWIGKGGCGARVNRDLHFSVSKFVSNFETVSNVKILVVNSLNIWDTVL